MKNFQALGLHPDLNASLEKMGYEKPTPIQAQSIPFALEGDDIMGTAQTGTGKTAAFAIPLMQKLLDDPKSEALVLVPTRELGKQIMDVMKQLIGQSGKIKTAFIIGGEPMSKQMNQLRNRPRLIVGTPGRINDHLQRKTLELRDTNFLVLDETDRMLDMGFSVQLERIFKYMPEKRQTLMFSATLPDNILKMSQQYMSNPKRIKVGQTNIVAQNIKTDVIKIDQSQKYDELIIQLHERNGSVIIFAKTKYGADRMAKNLRRDGFTAEALHGDLRQSKRERVMQNFRNDNFRILVATDIASRGLDVPSIEHVINFDLPQVAEDYIHRMGRTARAGASGSALCFVSPQDGRKWHAIECLLDPNKKSNDRKYDKTKPKRRKSNAANSNFKKDDKRNDKRGNRKKPFAKDDKNGKRNFKKPYAKKRDGESRSDDERSENTYKKPYKQSRNRRDNQAESDDKKKSYKKPFRAKNDGDKLDDKPWGDKPRGERPKNGKPVRKKSKSGKPDFKRSKSSDGKGFHPKTSKKKPGRKNNAKKRSF